jgi:hypothetical protein
MQGGALQLGSARRCSPACSRSLSADAADVIDRKSDARTGKLRYYVHYLECERAVAGISGSGGLEQEDTSLRSVWPAATGWRPRVPPLPRLTHLPSRPRSPCS